MTQDWSYTVIPIMTPYERSRVLKQLIPHIEYQVMIRFENETSETIVFYTYEIFWDAGKQGTIVVIVLILWSLIILSFMKRWGKITEHLPYQPVYSAEMAEKIAQNELRLITQLSFGPLDFDNLSFGSLHRNSSANLKIKSMHCVPNTGFRQFLSGF
ncbi:uncharacterized protein LOC111710075 [Eurytemora carolleeae]|uniref:uncharacterized protein LOC111710075 n=1 Tax=Eurytemora carolleeae TaxID=1294199 RepID=UPI000C793653|nr:uncharacterized protein LOC111710075 [Eurytemora carolleeae]|eukprot:XP_023339864.1 uncharacterized protein LOC111710075 [Eurytemora affinis]